MQTRNNFLRAAFGEGCDFFFKVKMEGFHFCQSSVSIAGDRERTGRDLGWGPILWSGSWEESC